MRSRTSSRWRSGSASFPASRWCVASPDRRVNHSNRPRATYQAGEVGNQLGGASNLINGSSGDLNRLASGADQMADGLGSARGQINQSIGSVRSLVEALATIQSQFGGGTTMGQLGDATKIIAGIRQLGQIMEANFAGLQRRFRLAGPGHRLTERQPRLQCKPGLRDGAGSVRPSADGARRRFPREGGHASPSSCRTRGRWTSSRRPSTT